MSYDPICFELAKAFLADEDPLINTEKHREQLAQWVQNAVESCIEIMRIELAKFADDERAK